MTDDTITQFRQTVWDYYHDHGRHALPWRQPETSGDFDPYKILVSELMLQQTQVTRVLPKYAEFLEAFPSFEALAQAPLGAVLRVWSGLGYNRRAKFLHLAAQAVVAQYGGALPREVTELVKLPGIGHNTAGAILAYAFDEPVVFIETNIRTVFIHHFFKDEVAVADKLILEYAGATLDCEHPREWYWALMDYGAHLKQTLGNLSRQSKAYAKQSTFQGSRRQLRGQVLRLLADQSLTAQEIKLHLADERLTGVLQDLLGEGLIRLQQSHYSL